MGKILRGKADQRYRGCSSLLTTPRVVMLKFITSQPNISFHSMIGDRSDQAGSSPYVSAI